MQSLISFYIKLKILVQIDNKYLVRNIIFREMKKIFLLFLFLSINLNSQTNFPKNYFSNPLDIDLILNGTFGELRSSHFHSGLDFKTQFKEGLNIYSAAEGYVSRISIKHGGFGKAIYINHPNGYTTVYAHLKSFNDEIENYIKKLQYEKQTYQIEKYLKKDVLKIKRKQIIGKSGNTGSSSGPHLHFETRKTSNQKALNPKLFDFKIKDNRHPIINSAFIYKIDSLNNYKGPVKIKLKKINDSLYESNTIEASGKVGFGISGFDRQDLAYNKNGIYNYTAFLNNNKSIEFKFDEFYFQESIKIKTLIDYEYYIKNKKRIIKLFKDKGNDLSVYSGNLSGFVDIVGKESEYLIEISDIAGNKTKIKIPILNSIKETKLKNDENLIESNKKIKNDLDYNFNFKNSKIQIPKNTFLKDVKLNIKNFEDSIKIENPYVPLFKNIKIDFLNNKNSKGDYLAYRNFDGVESFASSKLDNKNYFNLKTKSLGTYFIKTDSINPIIKPNNFNNGDWMSKKELIKFTILDKETGIKSYQVKINDKWILFEYEYKKNELFYRFDSYFKNNRENKIEITVEDMVGNKTEKIFTFYRD